MGVRGQTIFQFNLSTYFLRPPFIPLFQIANFTNRFFSVKKNGTKLSPALVCRIKITSFVLKFLANTFFFYLKHFFIRNNCWHLKNARVFLVHDFGHCQFPHLKFEKKSQFKDCTIKISISTYY